MHCTQIGHPNDGPISNVTVTGLLGSNTGDDTVALFNVEAGGRVTHCNIRSTVSQTLL